MENRYLACAFLDFESMVIGYLVCALDSEIMEIMYLVCALETPNMVMECIRLDFYSCL